MQYYVQGYERLLKGIMPCCQKVAGKRVDQTLIILDLSGASMGMVSKKVYNFIQLASKVSQDNYPEIMGKFFLLFSLL